MATYDIFMPALSSTMTEGKIVEWLKKPGEKVSRGESVLVVESDKADMDVESFENGYLAAVLMPAGSTAPVGETIGLIVETEAEIASISTDTPPPASNTSENKKSSNQSTSENAPEATQVVKPSSPSGLIQEKRAEAKSPVINTGRIVATPRAKKIASQRGVDLSTVRGTGPHGRIQADDVKRAVGEPITIPWVAESNAPATIQTIASTSKPAAKNTKKAPIASSSFGSPGENISFNTLQQAVNRNMEASLEIPCFRVGYTINTNKLDLIYKDLKLQGVTMTALLAKAVGVTLGSHPQVNAFYGLEGMSYPSEINVAIAVAMEDGGLITPVLKNADRTDLFELSRQWSDLVKRSRNKQLKPDEYNSGTFTLSNLGMFGVDRFDAILPPGTGGILAVASSRPTVVANSDGAISIKRQMQVNLTADHRVVYGAHGASFLKDLASLIEDEPESLI